MLRLLCEAVGVEFSESMLSWPPGFRETDGVWATHWYREVAKTHHSARIEPDHDVPSAYETTSGAATYYEQLYQ